MHDREGYFMSYTSKNTYWVYFPDSQQIKTIQDLEFDESYSYQEMGIKVKKEPLFSFSKLKFFTTRPSILLLEIKSSYLMLQLLHL